MVKSIAGWLYLLWKRPFFIGDRIQIDNMIGDVIDIRAFKFSLNEIGNWVHADQSTGRVMHVPNSILLSKTIINYTEGFHHIWVELPVLVTFESDWRKAKELLLAIAQKHSETITPKAQEKIKDASKKYMIFYHKLTPIVYTSVKDCGVLLTMRLLSEPRRRRNCEEAIWEDILDAFAEHKDIDFAYPTQRFYDHVTEGKQAIPQDILRK
jgi:small-conductance mechanosensitive channel